MWNILRFHFVLTFFSTFYFIRFRRKIHHQRNGFSTFPRFSHIIQHGNGTGLVTSFQGLNGPPCSTKKGKRREGSEVCIWTKHEQIRSNGKKRVHRGLFYPALLRSKINIIRILAKQPVYWKVSCFFFSWFTRFQHVSGMFDIIEVMFFLWCQWR